MITGKFLMKCYVVSKISGKQGSGVRIWGGLKLCLKDEYAAVKTELTVCAQTSQYGWDWNLLVHSTDMFQSNIILSPSRVINITYKTSKQKFKAYFS